jgi:hypothetical protein
MPGLRGIQNLMKLRDDRAPISTGRALEKLPEIDDKLCPVAVAAAGRVLMFRR